MSRLILLTALLFSNFIYCQDLSIGLRAYYPFNGNANDESGNNNNPVFNNATLADDKDGNPNSAYQFNGTDTYMEVLNSPSLNMDATMSIAVKMKAYGFYTGACYNNMLLIKADVDYVDGYYWMRFSDVIYGCQTNASTTVEQFYGANSVAPDPIVQLNQWYDVVWTSDGDSTRIYVNCELKHTDVQTEDAYTNFYDLYIGKMNNWQYPYWFNGIMDEIRIYDRVLTQEEVNLYSGCAVEPPAMFTRVSATVVDKTSIRVDWTTINEAALAAYSIERKETGMGNFTAIGNVTAHNIAGENNYSFTDHTSAANTDYQYRVVMVAINGSKKYSDQKTARIENNDFFITVNNNPASNTLGVTTNNYNGPATFCLYNSMGQVVQKNEMLLENNRLITLNINQLSTGYYWLVIHTNKETVTKKILVANK